MLKNILPAMVVLAIVSFYLKPKDSVPLRYEVESIVASPVCSFGDDTQNLAERIAKIERTDNMQFAKFATARWVVDDQSVTSVPDDTAPQAEVQTAPVAPSAAPVKSGGSNGSYSQSVPMRSGGSNGSYSQTMQYSTPVYTQVVKNGGSNGSYSTAVAVPRYSSVPVTTARVRSVPYKTVNRAVSGGCTGSYSMQSVQVPVRGPVRKIIANVAARRSAPPVSYSVQASAPMQMQYSEAPCDPNCPPDCDCYQQSSDGGIVSPYSMSYPGPIARGVAPVVNFIDNLTPMRSSVPMMCTPAGCVPLQ